MESSRRLLLTGTVARAVVTTLPKLLFASMELETLLLVFQKINISFSGGASTGRKRVSGGWFRPSAVTYVNLAQDFVNSLFLHSDSVEDFC